MKKIKSAADSVKKARRTGKRRRHGASRQHNVMGWRRKAARAGKDIKQKHFTITPNKGKGKERECQKTHKKTRFCVKKSKNGREKRGREARRRAFGGAGKRAAQRLGSKNNSLDKQ